MFELLSLADQNRSVTATNMNEHSSRSHLMLNVTVESTNRVSGQTTWGKLHLVDLAGSERISKSGAAGQALKEAQVSAFDGGLLHVQGINQCSSIARPPRLNRCFCHSHYRR